MLSRERQCPDVKNNNNNNNTLVRFVKHHAQSYRGARITSDGT